MAKKKEKLKQKLLHKYRLVIVNDDTFEEKLSFNLSRLNVFVLFGLTSIGLIVLTTLLIAFTPLREYIPGYSSTSLRRTAINNTEVLDSIRDVVRKDSIQIEHIRKVLIGDIQPQDVNKDSLRNEANKDFEGLNLTASKADSLLREKVEREDKYNIFENDSKENIVLFTPASGPISDPYNVKDKHYAVDVVLIKDAPIKAVADGTVIFAEWTSETGYVIIIEHPNDLISVYKHNSVLNKTQGDFVKAGEVIASAGSTGELSTGPHLHFELWMDGHPVNPQDFIDFK
ncbi:MAG: M23 family metallopeptidase [Flavobacteriaceae bacterium]|nr:M23 family metallopeptidase [Flavobacteriaceae bacterium]